MADRVVTFLVEHLNQLIGANFLSGVLEDEVKSLQRELRLINNFLKNSEGKRNEHEMMKEIFRQIREVAYEAEDVIDTFILNVAEQRKRNVVGKIICSIPHTKMIRDVAKKIEGLNKEINKIFDNIKKHGIERVEASVDAAVEAALHRRRRDVEEDDAVGFVHDSDALVKQLIEGDSELDVISIIGMGGLGKTTLAKKIYNNVLVKSHFRCYAWVYVSHNFRAAELLLEILKSQMPISDIDARKHEGMNEDQLKKYLGEKLFEYLQGKRYLVVMDDIWKTEVWDEVRSAFPDNLNGSRILITGRIKEVALHASLTPPYFLPCLNKDESWELFHKKVFRGEECPPELETLGRRIAEGCRGLPLSIVILAGLLANKEKTGRSWWKVIADVNWYLTQATTICKDILTLSYTHLPQRLKPCFLYFGVYPEDFEIPVTQLIQLWIAEGFIQHSGKRNIEDIAKDYLEELIDRSLIQVASRRSDEGAKKCHIHDLLRDICVSESAEQKFVDVPRDVNLSSWKKSRRLSIQGSTLDLFISSNPLGPSCARSLLSFGQGSNFNTNHWNWVHKNFKLLRVLHIELHASHSPKNIETLIHLRYLMMHFDSGNNIPTSLGNLTNLETLGICGTSPKCLPDSIWKLPRLRNLFGNVTFPNHLDTALWNLQVLSHVSLNPQIGRLIVEAKLPNIRKLGITNRFGGLEITNDSGLDGLASLHHLSHLQTFKFRNLAGFISFQINSFPETITKITLQGVTLEDGGGMELLGKLPKLRTLKLLVRFSSNGLHVHARSFPELQFLKLRDFEIIEWRQCEGAMRNLRHLVIDGCPQLTMLPSELWSLPALREVEMLMSNLKLAKMLQELHMKVGFKLLIFPPLDANFYENPAGANWTKWARVYPKT